MNYKGAVFFDYDGTLVDDVVGIHLPTETTKKALKELSQNGYMVVLNSGRSKATLFDMGIDFDGYVLMNGSYAEVDGKEVYKKAIEEDKLKELLSELDKLDLVYFCEAAEKNFINKPEDKEFINYITTYQLGTEKFERFEHENLPETCKLQVIYGKKATLEEVTAIVPEWFVIDDHRNGISTDVSLVGSVKAVGVEKICEYFNIPKENTYAFGDNTNDYDMLKYVGHGVAMGKHAPELDDVAETVTDRVENEGIYKALVKYGLITP